MDRPQKRFIITKDVVEIIASGDTDLNEIRRLIWSLPPIPEWATHFAMQGDHFNAAEIPGGRRDTFIAQEIPK